MKFLHWCVGVMQILTGLMLAWSIAPAWRWVWLPLAVLWFFVGLGLAAVSLARLATGKWRVGAARGLQAGVSHAPTDKRED
jgi:hypothetical protein